jgi:hypothetical protein
MRFDPSGLTQAFDRMQKAAKDKGKNLATDQGNFFLRTTRKLGYIVAPSKDDLFAVFRKLGNKIKRKKGVTPMKELMRRIRARGTFARGWKIEKVESSGTRIRIYIGNAVKYAGIVENKERVASRSADIVGAGYKAKLQKLAKQVTSIF